MIEDDILKELIEWPIAFLVKNKLLKLITGMSYLILTLEWGLGLYVFYYDKLEFEFWAKYSLFALGGYIVIVSYAILAAKYLEFYKLTATYFPKLRSLSSAGKNTFEELQKQAKFAKIITIMMMINVFMLTISAAPWVGNEYDFYFTVKYINDWFGEGMVAQFLLVCFYGQILHVAPILAITVMGFVYLLLHLKFQIILLVATIKRIEIDGAKNGQIQKEIHRELKDCIQHHQLIISFANRINEFIFYPMIAGLLSFSGALVAIIIYASSAVSGLKENMVRVTFSLISVPLFASCIMGGGQDLENVSNEIFEATRNLPWYLYNSKNRQLVLMLLTKSLQVINLSASGIIIMNASYFIKICRSLYTIVTWFIQVN